jgi:integrase
MKNKMAKPLGVTAASKGRAPAIRICIPTDLQEAYGGRKDIRLSLGRVEWGTAKAKSAAIRAQYEAEFEAKRKALLAGSSLAPVAVVTPELAEAIAHGVYAASLAQDDQLREGKQERAALQELAALTRPRGLLIGEPSQHSTGDGLSEAGAAALAGLNAIADGSAGLDLARRRLQTVLPAADDAARALGLDVDWGGPGADQALRASLEQERRARADRSSRDHGKAIATPTAPTLDNSKVHTLHDVVPLWEATKLPSRTLVSKTKSAVALVDQCLGKLPLRAYTKPQGVTVVAYLLEHSGAQKTALDKMNAVKALLNFAVDQQGWIDSNPWRAHTVTVKKKRTRVDLQPEVLTKLFDSPLFKSYALPSSTKAGGAAAYWVPLLGLYTGARQSDLCQLRVEDVTDHPVMGLSVAILADAGDDDEDSPQTTTKSMGHRRVPIHSDLIALGFADYFADVKAGGHAALFPDVKHPAGTPAGTNFTKWWSAYRKAQGVTRRYHDFHAFRHTSRTRLTDEGVEGTISDALLGHVEGQSTGRRIYDHSLKTLRANLEKLSFPELGLVRCYPVTSKK